VNKVLIRVLELATSISQKGTHTIKFGEYEGKRKFMMVIGNAEANAINLELSAISPARPFTHDLMKNMMDTLGITLNEICITRLQNGVFDATIDIEHLGEKITLEARPTDAVTLALKFGANIFILEHVLDQIALNLPETETDITSVQPRERKSAQAEESASNQPDYQRMKPDALQQSLQDALQNEDYELAAMIRDVMNHRGIS
jgi:uncharacterized protein